MNYIVVLNYIGNMMRIEAAAMLPGFLISLYKHEHRSAYAFFLTIVFLAAIGSVLAALRAKRKEISHREGFAIVGVSWILLSLFGAVPLFLSGEGQLSSYMDCFFEIASGFTTTGASILTDIEALPMGILYWRSFTHWLGGMGILVFMLAIMPSSGTGGSIKILRAESPGPIVGKLVPKMRDTAKILYLMYIFLTVLEVVFLLCGGMPLFDSLLHTFGTAGTGGFSIKGDSIAAYDSAYVDGVIGVFMLLFGVNFNVYYLLLTRNFLAALTNREVLTYFGIVGASVGAITLNTLRLFGGLGKAFRYSFFQVASIITTTGYATADFDKWPEFSRCLLVMLMIIGACAGSTGGGIKVARLVILYKSMRNSVQKMLHPKSVKVIKMDGAVVEPNVVAEINAYLLLYVVIFLLSCLVVSFDNFNYDTTVTSVIACLNNIGPGLGLVGPTGNYSMLSDLSKLVLSADMLLGRLEIFPLIMMFTPMMWKRSR